jgi:assimilatory nitrate reductase catalytic subunit
VLAGAFITQTVPRGQIFIPMHCAEANRLTLARFDPYSGQPAYKACAVKVCPAGLL